MIYCKYTQGCLKTVKMSEVLKHILSDSSLFFTHTNKIPSKNPSHDFDIAKIT